MWMRNQRNLCFCEILFSYCACLHMNPVTSWSLLCLWSWLLPILPISNSVLELNESFIFRVWVVMIVFKSSIRHYNLLSFSFFLSQCTFLSETFRNSFFNLHTLLMPAYSEPFSIALLLLNPMEIEIIKRLCSPCSLLLNIYIFKNCNPSVFEP